MTVSGRGTPGMVSASARRSKRAASPLATGTAHWIARMADRRSIIAEAPTARWKAALSNDRLLAMVPRMP